MTPHYSDPLVTLLHGDCVEQMRDLPDASVDSIVTDPPYGLEFMGKDWDRLATVGKQPKMGKATGDPHRRHTGTPAFGANGNPTCRNCGGDKYRNGERKCSCDAPDFGNHAGIQSRLMQHWHYKWATEAFRVLKPGGYLLAFGGTRTVHRLASAIEDAGFEIRDMLMWIYASGFPKSLDVGKAMDKAAGAEREVLGQSPNWRESKRNREEFGSMEVRGENAGLVTAPATNLAKQWDGWGTALKPAHEPIVMARKPLVGTVAGNVARYGTGAINVDGTRIQYVNEQPPDIEHWKKTSGGWKNTSTAGVVPNDNSKGRWPSNTLLSDPELFDQPNPYVVVGSGADARTSGFYEKAGEPAGMWGLQSEASAQYADSGGYSRFFLVPKADRAERERGLAGTSDELHINGAFAVVCNKCNRQKVNVPGAACKCEEPEWVRRQQKPRANLHPTVKPIDLMRHLVLLVTPPGGTVLDPFLGSGTTALAASEEGFRCIGIEREAEYLDIAKGRLMATPMGLGLDVPAATKRIGGGSLEEIRARGGRHAVNDPDVRSQKSALFSGLGPGGAEGSPASKTTSDESLVAPGGPLAQDAQLPDSLQLDDEEPAA